jgi:hypothetical protein
MHSHVIHPEIQHHGRQGVILPPGYVHYHAVGMQLGIDPAIYVASVLMLERGREHFSSTLNPCAAFTHSGG